MWRIRTCRLGKGGGHPDPEIRGWGGLVSEKNFFALRASVWSKNKGAGVLLWICHCRLTFGVDLNIPFNSCISFKLAH